MTLNYIMSLNLPGYYYDPARNRYFPITSLPPGAPIPAANASGSSSSSAAAAESSLGHMKKKRKTVAGVSQPEGSRSNVPRNNSSLWGMVHSVRSNPGISFAERSHIVQYVSTYFELLHD